MSPPPAGDSLRHRLRELAEAFRSAGLDTPEVDARRLVAAAAGKDAAWLIAHADEPASADVAERIARFGRERLARRPVARILGTREFWGHRFALSAAALEPRPDTETLVEAAFAIIAEQGLTGTPLRILDLGTGSGCILVSLLAGLPLATGVGTDTSREALATAAENATAAGVADRARFQVSDWLDGVTGRFDLVVSNPPYIATGEIPGLAPEVAWHDPVAALDGGTDGLEAYRRIADKLLAHLENEGLVLLEHGLGQAPDVTKIMAARCPALGSRDVLARSDLAGLARVLIWRRQPSTVI